MMYFYRTNTEQDLREIACYIMGTPSLHLVFFDAGLQEEKGQELAVPARIPYTLLYI